MTVPAKPAATTMAAAASGDKPTASTAGAKPNVAHIQQAVPIFHHQTANSSLSQVLKQFSAVNTSVTSGGVGSANASTTVLVTGQQAGSVGLGKQQQPASGAAGEAAAQSDTKN
jgi:hypothetical protein